MSPPSAPSNPPSVAPILLGGCGWPLTRLSHPHLLLCADPRRSDEALAAIESGSIDPDAFLLGAIKTRLSPIRVAALNGSWRVLDALLERSSNPLSSEPEVCATLHSIYGALHHFPGCEPVFERLARLGASFNQRFESPEQSPLGIALMEGGFSPFSFDAFSLILRLGANPSDSLPGAPTPRSLLFHAFLIAIEELDSRYAHALLSAGASALSPEPPSKGQLCVAHALAYACPDPRLGDPSAGVAQAISLLERALDTPGGPDLLNQLDDMGRSALQAAESCASPCLPWLKNMPERLASLAEGRAISDNLLTPRAGQGGKLRAPSFRI